VFRCGVRGLISIASAAVLHIGPQAHRLPLRPLPQEKTMQNTFPGLARNHREKPQNRHLKIFLKYSVPFPKILFLQSKSMRYQTMAKRNFHINLYHDFGKGLYECWIF
jgi:hypothetical protein